MDSVSGAHTFSASNTSRESPDIARVLYSQMQVYSQMQEMEAAFCLSPFT